MNARSDTAVSERTKSDANTSSEQGVPPKAEHGGMSRPVGSPLLLDGWLEFNRQKFDIDVLKIDVGGQNPDDAMLRAALFLDKRGRMIRPKRIPYIPVSFVGTPTPYAHRIEHQWHEMAQRLVNEMRTRTAVNQIHLPPSIQDARPWQWSGYNVGVRYTFLVEFPFRMEAMSKNVRSRIRRSEKNGFRAVRTNDFAAIYSCVKAAEERQGYSLGLTLEDLRLLHGLLGDEHLYGFVAYAPNGEPASAALLLHDQGSAAIGWIGGTVTAYLNSGAADLIEVCSWDALHESGATAIDLCGANMASIAAYKSSFGARLVPYYSIEAYDSRRMAKWLKSWWDFRHTTGED